MPPAPTAFYVTDPPIVVFLKEVNMSCYSTNHANRTSYTVHNVEPVLDSLHI